MTGHGSCFDDSMLLVFVVFYIASCCAFYLQGKRNGIAKGTDMVDRIVGKR